MSTTIGRVNFTATIDGRRTPQDAERVGRQMGSSASEGFDKTWSKGFQDTLTEQGKRAFKRWDANGRQSGDIYGKAFNSRLDVYLKSAEKNFAALRLDPGFLDEFGEKFADAGLAAGDLQRQIKTLNDENKISASSFRAAQRQVDDWAHSQRNAAIDTNLLIDANDKHEASIARLSYSLDADLRRATGAMDIFNDATKDSGVDLDAWTVDLDKASGSADRNAKSSHNLGSAWSKIPHNGRQVILITAAILGGLEQMATLGSAAGAGLLTVGAAAGQSVIGLGAAVAIFQGLAGDLEKLPEAVRPAAQAFQDLKDPLADLQDFLQITALSDAAADFDLLGDAVRDLTPAFEPLAKVIGDTLGRFAEWAADASKEGGDLFRLIEASAPTFEEVLGIIGTLGGALVTAFGDPAMQKSIRGLTGWLQDIADGFDDFVNSDSLDTWLENGTRIFEAFGGLLDGVSTTLNNLVDAEAVERTVSFLDNLTESLPFLESLIDVFGELDIFGLIAQLLNDVGNGLAPILEIMEPMGQIINDLLTVAFQQLGLALEFLAPLFLPVQIGWNLLAEVIEVATDWLGQVGEALGVTGDSIGEVTDRIVEVFNPAIEAIGDAVEAMLPSPEEFAEFLTSTLVPAIEDVASWIETDMVPAIELFVRWINDDAIPAIQDFAEWFNEELGPVLEDVATWLQDSGDDFKFWGDVIAGVLSALLGPIGWAISAFDNLFGAASRANSASQAGAGGGGGAGHAQFMASGGILTNPTHVIAGEAGREAFVPLDRPLSLVDPSVRWLSAIARGQSNPAMAAGGVVGGGGGGVTFGEGSIVVQGATDPAATGIAVLNRAAEMLS